MSDQHPLNSDRSRPQPQPPAPEAKPGFFRRIGNFVIDSIGKIILIFILLLVASIGSLFFWGGAIISPFVKSSIEFVFGMNSEWDSISIDWFKKTIKIKNIVIYQPAGFNEDVFFTADSFNIVLNEYSGIQTLNIRGLTIVNPRLIWEFKPGDDSFRAFFAYINSGKDSDIKYEYRVDGITIKNGIFRLKDYVSNVRGVNLSLEEIDASVTNLTNYFDKKEALPTQLDLKGKLSNSRQRAESPLSFKFDVNLLTYQTNFKADLNVKDVDLTVLDPYCVRGMGLHLTQGRLGVHTLVAECINDKLKTSHHVDLDYLDFDICKPGESAEEPWLRVEKWVKRLDAPEDQNKFTIDLHGKVGKDASLELYTSDIRIRMVLEKMSEAINRWFDGAVQLRRRNRFKEKWKR